jgi:hypothetical protein
MISTAAGSERRWHWNWDGAPLSTGRRICSPQWTAQREVQTLQDNYCVASWVVHHPLSAEDQAAMAAMRAIVEPNKGELQGQPLCYIDLYRVEGRKIVERCGLPEENPPQEELKNANGML